MKSSKLIRLWLFLTTTSLRNPFCIWGARSRGVCSCQIRANGNSGAGLAPEGKTRGGCGCHGTPEPWPPSRIPLPPASRYARTDESHESPPLCTGGGRREDKLPGPREDPFGSPEPPPVPRSLPAGGSTAALDPAGVKGLLFFTFLSFSLFPFLSFFILFSFYFSLFFFPFD